MKSLSRVRLLATPWTVACTRILHPWDSPGKSTGVGCHFLLQGILKKDLAALYVTILPMFSSKSFIVSGLTFRSLIHFEFIFVYGVRECSNFILLHVAVHFFSPATLIEETIFPPLYILASFVIDYMTIYGLYYVEV